MISGKDRLKCKVVLQSDLTLKYKAQKFELWNYVHDNLSFNYRYLSVLITQLPPVCAAIQGKKDECSLLSSLCWGIQALMKYGVCVFCH